MTCSRQQAHDRAVRSVARQLVQHGVDVDRIATRAARYRGARGDIRLTDGRWLAVRAGAMGSRIRHVVRIGGKPYEYFYRQLMWNCHLHGKKLTKRPDAWVLVERRAGHASMWIVPDEIVRARGLTVHLRTGDRPTAGKRAWVQRWRERWDVLSEARAA